MKASVKDKRHLYDERTSFWSERPYPYGGTNNHHQIIIGRFDMPLRWWTIVITPCSAAPGQDHTFKHTDALWKQMWPHFKGNLDETISLQCETPTGGSLVGKGKEIDAPWDKLYFPNRVDKFSHACNMRKFGKVQEHLFRTSKSWDFCEEMELVNDSWQLQSKPIGRRRWDMLAPSHSEHPNMLFELCECNHRFKPTRPLGASSPL